MAKYNTEWLLKEVEKETRIKYLFFWGHQPKKDGTIGASCLSQWWESAFEVDGVIYNSAEHWMMAGKAKLFGDEEVLEKILACKSPAEAKKLGRQVSNFDSKRWEEQAYDIVIEGSVHKFGQNAALNTYLLNTANQVLVEASPLDAIWGIGLSKDHQYAEQPQFWRGTNLLGFALMEARDRLSGMKNK